MEKRKELEKTYTKFLGTLDKNLVNNKKEIVEYLNELEQILLEIVKDNL